MKIKLKISTYFIIAKYSFTIELLLRNFTACP